MHFFLVGITWNLKQEFQHKLSNHLCVWIIVEAISKFILDLYLYIREVDYIWSVKLCNPFTLEAKSIFQNIKLNQVKLFSKYQSVAYNCRNQGKSIFQTFR